MDIVLASSSPRRKELLKNLNINFKVIPSDIEEDMIPNEKPEIMAMRLAFTKALDIANKNQNSTVIGADTIVVLNDNVLGKPKDENDAFNMLKNLSNTYHQVITGISVINLSEEKKIVDYVVSDVKFKKIDDEKIKRYIDTKEPLDKAGAYGIQGYGSLLVEEIKGDYFNIVGLPISKLDEILLKYFHIQIL
jgi:septum formation protein